MKCLQNYVFLKKFFYLWICVCTISVAQPRRLVDCYRLNYVNHLPKALLTTRSAVLVSTTQLQHWKHLANQAQQIFATLGIDVVTYALQGHVYLGEEIARQYIQRLHKREVHFILLLDFLPQEKIVCTIMSFSSTTLIDVKQGAWQRQTKTLEGLRLALQQSINYQKIENKNFLINEYAEFSNPLNIKIRRIVKGLPKQFSRQYLAVAQWRGYCVEDCKCKEETAQINQTITDWFSKHYADRTYKIIDYSKYQELFSSYEYVLFFVYGEDVDSFFPAASQKYNNTSVTQRWRIYVKHIPSDLIYYPAQGAENLEQVLEQLL